MDIEDIQSQRDYYEHCRQVHHYSPAINKILNLSESYIPDAEKAYKEGKTKAIWSGGVGWQVPLIYACDTIPVAYGEMGRLSDKEAMQIAEDYYQFPVETCSMVKCTVGQWHLRRNTSTINRILGNSSACEPYNLAWEIMKREGYDVYNNDVVYRGPTVEGKRLEKLIQFLVDEIYDVAEWLTGSRKIDEDKLIREIQRKNRLLNKLKTVLELRRKHPFYVRSLATIVMLNIGLNNYFGKPEEYEAAIDLLIEELENKPVDEKELKKVIPLVWAGGTGQEFGIYEAIDQAGGALLGLRSVPFKLYREDVPPVESLARWVYDNAGAGAGVYARNVLEHEVDKLNARGLILYGYIGCSFASVDREMWRKYFHAKGIPSINLEGSFQTGAPTGQVITRVKAFVEMLS
ncbi:MAG TPA: 2-hydroxyacyl-CoA dehydratase family protein [Methylomusa anaerophila]|uniref:2-hydroxyglutaryl-CoA dehydratase, D-component n=1 Tax=Methylomusa anaerophila TaxID=1930071 RepID=A0A348AEM2_9FIRM|nr:2-hydroxyacyl-CoA dehydratase family protein [Methylomusa anaerophila]BBB89520.1 2-hydroxyglutaryl-CoA dehydratase, D-component [Methylomusa anaerophila]HML90110.1 2-hydroxyacyl-CoA dehydratase family protein [Methylomusa anaerophila]